MSRLAFLLGPALLLSLPACSLAQPVPAQEQQASGVSVTRHAPGLDNPWSIAFLPDGAMLVTEKFDGLVRVDAEAKAKTRIAGLPKDVVASGQSGWLDVVLDPDFAANRTLYLAYLRGSKAANRLAVLKGRLEGDALAETKLIFETADVRKGDYHPGGRMVFLADKTFLLSVGDGFAYRDKAQDPGSHLGKILRLDRDGKAPADNPFIGKAGALAEVYTLGHRNIQGLALDPETKTVWAHEHGPMGGDEINRITPGTNYGWPRVSHGLNYDGSKVSDLKTAPGFAEAQKIWVPSIAPSGLAVLRGVARKEWEGQMLVGALSGSMIVRLRWNETTQQWDEADRMFADFGERIRDVRVAPDGSVVVLADGSGELWRVK